MTTKLATDIPKSNFLRGLAGDPAPRLFKKPCTHHWVIESPVGPTSWGTCKRCGEDREFLNDPLDRALAEDSRRDMLDIAVID